jgi:hypothetical protein
MVEMDAAGAIAQLGAAGLIGWMWLTERRAAVERERQIREAHDRLMQERQQAAAVVEMVRENTRALVALEGGHRRMEEAVDRLAGAVSNWPHRVRRTGDHPEAA